MGFDMRKMMKQVQKMQEDVARVQGELADRTVEATSGGGVVRVVVTGGQEIRSISIDPQAIDPNDKEMLEDLLLAAVNEGLNRSKEMVQTEMAKVTGGMNLPGMP